MGGHMHEVSVSADVTTREIHIVQDKYENESFCGVDTVIVSVEQLPLLIEFLQKAAAKVKDEQRELQPV